MKEFIVRLFSLLAIVGVLFGYNEVLDVRAKDEEIAKLNAQLEVQHLVPAVILSQGVIQEMEQDTRMEPIPEKRMDLAERLR